MLFVSKISVLYWPWRQEFVSHTHRHRQLNHGTTTRMSLYDKFAEFGIMETCRHTEIFPFPIKEKFRNMTAVDGKTTLHAEAFQSSKIRLLRSLTIDDVDGMQVFDFAVFPKYEFDLPIFCANFFSTTNMNIIVLDLNPLYDVKNNEQYKRKYYPRLMPLAHKYVELLPWGDKITSESLKFFSPIVIWTKFASSKHKQDILYAAFMDYFMDPGHRMLARLLGEPLAEELILDFLFNGALTLGSKKFLDFFPEYKCADGSINKQRSMAGKSFSKRPWDRDGRVLEI